MFEPPTSLPWQEVPADGIYSVSLIDNQTVRIPWEMNLYEWRPQQEIAPEINYMNLSLDIIRENYTEMAQAIDGLYETLYDSVGARIVSICIPFQPKVARFAVLFSGGIDCTCIAFLIDKWLPKNEPVDLINVAFENTNKQTNNTFDVPDRITGILALEELKYF